MCEREPQGATPPTTNECVYFTNNKKHPGHPPALISMNQLRMSPWHARHPSTPQHILKPPTVPLMLHRTKDAYQLSATPGALLKPCGAFVLLSCNSICLKIPSLLTAIDFFRQTMNVLRSHFVSERAAMTSFHCHIIVVHVYICQLNCVVCTEMNMLNEEITLWSDWRNILSEIKVRLQLNYILKHYLHTFEGWFTLNDHLKSNLSSPFGASPVSGY